MNNSTAQNKNPFRTDGMKILAFHRCFVKYIDILSLTGTGREINSYESYQDQENDFKQSNINDEMYPFLKEIFGVYLEEMVNF